MTSVARQLLDSRTRALLLRLLFASVLGIFLESLRTTSALGLRVRTVQVCVARLTAATLTRLERRYRRVRFDTAQVAQWNLRS